MIIGKVLFGALKLYCLVVESLKLYIFEIMWFLLGKIHLSQKDHLFAPISSKHILLVCNLIP